MLTDADRLRRQKERPAIVKLWRALQPLRSVVTFLQTGAHPDDESTSLLAALRLGQGVRIVFACATRGEGGQNGLGADTGADLGALRTREMEVAARDMDLSLRWLSESADDSIVDFGFSKHAEETLAKWGETRTLERLVRIIRNDRPDIVCPTFLDVPGQHGHHRAMTEAARRAVALAADPAAFPEHIAAGLLPWHVAKFYLPAWSGAGRSYDDQLPPPNATLVVDTGAFEPVNGATFAQIAQWSRAAHATQGMGHWLDAGAESRPLHLAWSRKGAIAAETSILDDLPRRLDELATPTDPPALHQGLVDAQAAVAHTLAAWPDTAAIGRAAAAALERVRLALALCKIGNDLIISRLEQKAAQLTRVMFEAAGLVVRVVSQPPVVAAGGTVTVRIHLFDGSGLVDAVPDVSLVVPRGWRQTPAARGSIAVTVADDARLSDGYDDRFEPSGGNGPVYAKVGFAIDGVAAVQPVDLEEALQIVPPVSVVARPSRLVFNLNRAGGFLTTNVSASANVKEIDRIDIAPQLPAGWSAEPECLSLGPTLGGPARADLTMVPPQGLAPGLWRVGLDVGGNPAVKVHTMDYAHTGTVTRAAGADIRIRTLAVGIDDRARIGVIGGGIDRVCHWLSQMGLIAVELDAKSVSAGDFSAFDCVVVGVFSFRLRPDLFAVIPRLHAWVEDGGHLVTLYHRPWDNWDPDRTPPAFLEIGQPSLRWRVTDEAACVTHLQPDHPLLTTPNRLAAEDWAGWHKERGLYFAAKWDPTYRALLAMADPGEAPLSGALLSAEIGRGRHSHTSLVLHHQMEHLVPGAFRIMANLATPAHPG